MEAERAGRLGGMAELMACAGRLARAGLGTWGSAAVYLGGGKMLEDEEAS